MASETEPAREDFYGGTLRRIELLMLGLGAAAWVTAWLYFGWRVGLGFSLGTLLAFLNFYWLKKTVAGVADLAAGAGRQASGRAIVARFLGRYFLMALVAFAILNVSRESLYGLFAGLVLPVAAILCEAAYEGFRVLIGR